MGRTGRGGELEGCIMHRVPTSKVNVSCKEKAQLECIPLLSLGISSQSQVSSH
jgi:hypothetical protein